MEESWVNGVGLRVVMASKLLDTTLMRRFNSVVKFLELCSIFIIMMIIISFSQNMEPMLEDEEPVIDCFKEYLGYAESLRLTSHL